MFATLSRSTLFALGVLCAACPEGPLAPPDETPDAGTVPDAGPAGPTLVPAIEGPAEVARDGSYVVALSEQAGLRVSWSLAAEGDCTVESAPTDTYRGRTFARVLSGTPGSCTVVATATFGAVHAEARHTATIVDAAPLRQENVPTDFLGCPLDSDSVLRLEGRTWCSLGRNGLAIYTDTPAETPTDFYPVALLDPTHVFACPVARTGGAKCSVRDPDGRLVAEVPIESVRREFWSSDGKSPARIVRTLKTPTGVQIDIYSWDGTTLAEEGSRSVDAPAAGSLWLNYLVVVIEPEGDAIVRRVLVFDATTGTKVHELTEVPYDSVVDVLSMRHLVIGREVYASLDQLTSGSGLSVGGLVSSPLDGINAMVSARREAEGSDLIRFDYFDTSGDVPVRLGFGHEWFVEPYRNFLVAGDGVLTSHRLSWISWLRPGATP